MANDNKNAHDLAAELDDDTTELELLPATWPDPALDYEAEADAATHAFENPDAAREGKSLETLQVALRERDDYIGRLEYDLEQLRARKSGLETELKAREAITEGVTTDLEETREALLAARENLGERDRAYAELESRLRESERARQESLETQSQLAGMTGKYEQELAARESLEARCKALEEQVAGLVSPSAALEAEDTQQRLRQENERLTGAVLGYKEEIRALREQAARNEAYADTLRRQVQAQAAELEAATASWRSTQGELEGALLEIEELREQLAAESRAIAALQEERSDERMSLEAALEDARTELSAAREAVAASRTANEQLESELAETTGSRRALESQLSQAEEARDEELARLEDRVERLQRDLEDAESKIENKDAAISVLLAELADKPQDASEVQAEIASARPAERRASAADEKHGADKERTTRLLIGHIDGQEVRFPLFKNKLTIGRTAHNDIQLKQQFISRRHAVVVCANDSTRIVDWGSKNGIYVNGMRVSEKVLKSGDQLTVGSAEFRFEERPMR